MAQSTPPPIQHTREAQDAEAAAWFYQHSSDGFALLRDQRVVSVNPAWCAIAGAGCEACIGQHVSTLFHVEDQAQYVQAVATLEAKGEVKVEHRLIGRDGQTRWVRAAVKQGQGGMTMVVMQDITVERAEQAKEDQARLAAELLRTTAGVFTWRFNPKTGRYLSDSDPQMTGTTQRDMSADDMIAEIHPGDQQVMIQAFNETLRTGEAVELWYRHSRLDGTWSRYRAAWRGLQRCDNGLYEILGLTQDMTALAEARDAALLGEQAAREAAETKSRFLANMSHEIRTPLNGVLGVLHLLRTEDLSASGQDLVAQALACGDMLTQLLNDVLDFSKIEAGRLELNPEPLDPKAALEGVAQMLRPAAEAKGLYLRTVVSDDLGWVSADPVRLRQVLFNLIGNAAKFTLAGGVEVRMAAVGQGAWRRLRIEVQDTGVGVEPDAIDALFERFHQADGSTTRRFGGTGLGLAITRSLVEQMDGEVHARSTVGQGSTFWFEIAAPSAQPAQADDEGDAACLSGLNVLVVEDNATNRLIAERMLEALGAVVTTAEDGAMGVELAATRAFDLIFMDIQMPGMDGMEAARRIRALAGPAARTSIVAMTANVFSHQVAEYLGAGMDGAIGKPLNPAHILAALARLTAAEAEPALTAVA